MTIRIWLAAVVTAACAAGCADPGELTVDRDAAPGSAPPDAAFDAAVSHAIPRFSTALHLDLDAIERISRFRAGVGHDFADSYEVCRSMKHYFCPRGCLDTLRSVSWTTLVVRSPVSGTVTRLELEQSYGTQIHIEPSGHPGWAVRIFHVTPGGELAIGSAVQAGQLLGTHASDNTMSDIAVQQYRPDGFRLVSYFETLDDNALASLVTRGVPSRDALIITAEARLADPLDCDGGAFTGAGMIANWVPLP